MDDCRDSMTPCHNLQSRRIRKLGSESTIRVDALGPKHTLKKNIVLKLKT